MYALRGQRVGTGQVRERLPSGMLGGNLPVAFASGHFGDTIAFVVRYKENEFFGKYYAIIRYRIMVPSPVGAMFVPSALKDAVQGILAILYSDFRLDTKTRDEIIRRRHAAGESQSKLAREFGISPQRVHQIVHFR